MSQSDFVTRGQALVAAGQYQEAVKVCRLGLLGRPTTVEGRVVLGQALLALKRYDEVLAEMRVALELDHTSIPAQVLKGEALLRKGDGNAAVDLLARAQAQAPNDARITQLLAEAERVSGRPAGSAGHPAVNFFAGEVPTKHYPNHSGVGDEESGPSGSYTRPTSLSAPGAKKRSSPRQAAQPEGTPSPAVLAVGDRSGTVEVDPDAEGVEVDEEDLGELAAPPPSGSRPAVDEDGFEAPTGWAGGRGSEARGSVKPSRSYGAQSNGESPFEVAARRPKVRKEVSSVELIADDLEQLDDDDDELFETKSRQNREVGPRSAVRAAVQVAPGPLHDPAGSGRMSASRPTAIGQAQAPLAQLLASQPRDQQQVGPPVPSTPSPLPPPPGPAYPSSSSASHNTTRGPGGPGSHGDGYTLTGPHGAGNAPLPRPYGSPPIAAAMPTMAAQPSATFRAPGAPPPAAAHAPTLALQTAPPPVADPHLFGHDGTPPAWSRPTMAAPAAPPPPQRLYADDPTRRPAPIDPGIAALAANSADMSGVASIVEPSNSGKSHKTGIRKARSRVAIVLWILIGTLVIGGGVFAGFQIRNMRLNRQITDARERATERAKADTWQGWITARESLANIVQASATLDNRAALARTKSLMAYEFGEPLADAKAAVDGLGGDGGLDVEIANAFIALAQNDVNAARGAADRALTASGSDPAALYVSAQTYLLAGDVKQAVAAFKSAYEGEPRPLYALGHARALAASGMLEEALAATDRALAASADNPAAAIVRAKLLVDAGRIVPNAQISNDVHTQLDRLIAEGGKPAADQTHGVSPAQLASINLALARVDFAISGLAKAINDVNAAAKIGYDDQRFAEEAVDTLYRIGHLTAAVHVAHDGIERYPNSRLLKISLAQILTAQGKPGDALELLAKAGDATKLALGLAARGDAKAASGDTEGARGDYDAALKKIPDLEVALVGKAWLDLAANQVDDARKLIEKRIKQTGNTVAMTTVYAAILRATGDVKARDDARKLLEKVAAGGQGVDAARAQLELARLYRDSNDFRAARNAYGEATRAGSTDARVETAQLQIEDHDPIGAKDTLDQLLKDLGDRVPANVLLEAARARMLAGDNAGGAALLEAAGKAPNVVKWQLDRERGRLALRRGDFAGAAQVLARALDSSGDDAETFLLGGDAIDGDVSLTALASKLKALAPTRLKGKPELQIVNGLLALALDTTAGEEAALTAYTSAREALDKEKASYRRLARANFGLALVAIGKTDPTAKDKLELVNAEDPSLYDAWLYRADNAFSRGDYKKALEFAQNATTFNPDSIAAWHRLGLYAARLNDQKTLAEAITQLNKLAPNTEELKELIAKKR